MFDQPVNLLFISLALALLPLFFALATSYLKINIVLSLLKNAIGAQQVPSGMIIMALSLSLTLLIMQPVLTKSISELETLDLSRLKDQQVSDVLNSLKPAFLPWRISILTNILRSMPPRKRQLAWR